MNFKQNEISSRLLFLQDCKNKKDVKKSPVFYSPRMEDIVSDIVKSLNNISSMFRISAFKLSFITNDDRESEMMDVKFKNKSSEFISMNIDDTIYYKLSMCLTINEHRCINKDEIAKARLIQSNHNIIHSLEDDWTIIEEDMNKYTYSRDTDMTSCVFVDFRLPEIRNSFIEMRNKMYYLTYSIIRKISFLTPGKKVIVNRFSMNNTNMDDARKHILRPYYYVSVGDDGVIRVEFDRTSINLFEVMQHFDIKLDTLRKSEAWHDHRIKATLEEFKSPNYTTSNITRVDFDRTLIYDAVLTLLGYKEMVPFKYYRYGSIVDAIAAEIVCNVAMHLPKATGPKGSRYFNATKEDLEKTAEGIKSTFKPNLFLNIMSSGDYDSIKSTYSEHCVFNPLKVSKDPSRIEMIFFEEDMDVTDIFGTSQTKKNILKTKSVPPFIDPKYLG